MNGGLIVFKNNWRIGVVAICGSSLMGLVPVTVADAANPESVTVDMTFMDPITVTEIESLRFGILDSNMANLEVVRVRPNGNVVDNDNNILGGTQAPADLTSTAQVGSTISIDAGNAGTATGYTLRRFRCRYNGATSDSNCNQGYTATAVASATLLVGGDVRGNGNAVVGVDNTTFDVTITYQ